MVSRILVVISGNNSFSILRFRRELSSNIYPFFKQSSSEDIPENMSSTETTSTATTTVTTTTTSTPNTTWTNDMVRDALIGASSRLPPFWTVNPEAWFIQADAHFAISRITSDISKYTHVIAQLPPEIVSKCLDCVKRANNSTNDKYETLKTEILQRLGMSEENRISNLLYHEQMGDQSPSEFYRKLDSLVGSSDTEQKFLLKIFTDRLPSPLDSTVIQLKAQGPQVFLPVLDSIWDKQRIAKPTIHSVETEDTKMILKKLELLEKKFNALELERRNSRSRSRSRSESQVRFKSSRGRSLTPKDSECYFHKKFGKDARKCTKWCRHYNKKNE